MKSRQTNQMTSLKIVESITQKLHTNSPNVSSTTIKHHIKVELPGYSEIKVKKPKSIKKTNLDTLEYPKIFKNIKSISKVFE